MSTPLYQTVARTPADIRDSFLRTYSNAVIQVLRAQGVSNPQVNVSVGSDIYILADALSKELSVVEANSILSLDQLLPDTATGSNLDRWLNVLGLARKLPSGSHGVVTLSSSLTSGTGTLIPQGSLLTDSANLSYQVSVGGFYLDQQQVPIVSVDTGSGTNHLNGDTLTWVTPPAFCATAVSVGIPGGADGLIDGTDGELTDDESPRQRLLAFLQNPPRGGNAEDVAEIAEAASTAVQKTFVYPVAQGPATLHFACTGFISKNTAGDIVSMSRTLDVVTMNTVVAYVQGLLPEHVYVVGTSVVSAPTNVVLKLTLPSAPTASPPGPGGGWTDGAPWPVSIGPGTNSVNVSNVTSSTVFTVTAQTAPTDGVSHVSFLNPFTWRLYTGVVLSHAGNAGAYQITVDKPFTGIFVGAAIWPQCQNQALYINTWLQACSQMGPGQKTTNASIIERGFRHPIPTISWPSDFGGTQLSALTKNFSEVIDASYIFRDYTTPPVPTVITDPPTILVPNNLSFYQQ